MHGQVRLAGGKWWPDTRLSGKDVAACACTCDASRQSSNFKPNPTRVAGIHLFLNFLAAQLQRVQPAM